MFRLNQSYNRLNPQLKQFLGEIGGVGGTLLINNLMSVSVLEWTRYSPL